MAGGCPALAVVMLSLALASTVASCGESNADDAGDRAAEIESRALAAEQAAARRENERASELPPTVITQVTTASQAPLPAGSEEIDGDGGQSATSTGSASGVGGLVSAADRRSFARLARTLPGSQGVVITTLGRAPIVRLGSVSGGVAWSTAKVPVAMAAIAAGTARTSDLRAAITASDNAAAERLWSGLGRPAVAANAATEQLRAAGDTRTVIQSQRLRSGFTAFGQTDWRLTDQTRFVAGMACTQPGKRVLSLMGQVASGQSWGLGSTGLPAKLKGGWGPGRSPGAADGWMERQMGVLTVSGRPVVVALANTGAGHDAGIGALNSLARWVAEHVDTAGAPRRPSC